MRGLPDQCGNLEQGRENCGLNANSARLEASLAPASALVQILPLRWFSSPFK